MQRLILLSVMLAMTPPLFAQATVHQATGVVIKLDREKVTINHGPVRSMNWPPMAMSFKVKDKALMDRLKKDEKVDFQFVQEGRDYVVTEVLAIEPRRFGPNEGEVLEVDREAREIAIRHGRLPELDMDPMSMIFIVADPNLLDGVKKGDRVKFKAGLVRGRFAVIAITALK